MEASNELDTVRQPVDLTSGGYVSLAESTLPKLVSVARRVAIKLGIDSIGIGPAKTVARAKAKAAEKYEGDLSRVLDYARCTLVVPSAPTLLAAVRLIRERCVSSLARIDPSSLLSAPKHGGFRCAVVNLLLGGMVCELVVCTEKFWSICGAKGVRQHFHSKDLGMDSLPDVTAVLTGTTRASRGDMIAYATDRYSFLKDDAIPFKHEREAVICLSFARLLGLGGFDRWSALMLRRVLRFLGDKAPNMQRNGNIREVKELLVRRYEKMGHKEAAADVEQDLEETDGVEARKVQVSKRGVKRRVGKSCHYTHSIYPLYSHLLTLPIQSRFRSTVYHAPPASRRRLSSRWSTKPGTS